jgi:hypothetical protein
MYSPDTMQRMNQEEVDLHYNAINDQAAKIENDASWAKANEKDVIICDYCDKPATRMIPIYNPADGVRDVEGAYAICHICEECDDQGYGMEDTFYCEGCDETFVTNHSLDVLYTMVDDVMYCQKCALELMSPVSLNDILRDLEDEDTGDWIRINAMPGKQLLWEGEFSEFSDFPGNTSLGQVHESILDAMEEKGLDGSALAYPLLTHGYQFSVVLAVYLDKEEG